MTEAEINLAIAKIEYPDCEFEQGSRTALCRYSSGEIAFQRDYCNNWSDIGPIIEREKIDLTATEDGWEANGYFYEKRTSAETPTKAAALCYLKMKEVE